MLVDASLLVLLVLLGVCGCRAVPASLDSEAPSPDTARASGEAPAVFIEAAKLEGPEQPDPATNSAPEPSAAPKPVVEATSSDPTLAAKQAYRMGLQRFEAHDYAGALQYFEAAHAHFPHPAMQYNIAHCHEELGHQLEACVAYLEVEADASADAGIRQDAARSRQRLGC